MNSLMDLDVGGAVKNAIALGNYEEDQRRNDLQEQNLALRQQQQVTDQQNANTQYMNSIHSFLNDDRVKFDPQLEGALMNRWSSLAGGPQVDFSAVQVGRESKRKLMQATMQRDAQGAMEAAGEIAMTLPAKDLPGFLKSLEEYGEVHERVLKLAQDREVNAEKYQKLQDNNALVAYARPLYTATSSAFRDQLRMTENPDFKKLQSLYAVTKQNGGNTSSLLSSRPTPGVNKQAVSPLLDGGLANTALKADAEAQRLNAQIQQDSKMLDDHMHGIPLPDGVTPSMLRARIDTDSSLMGNIRVMQDWYEEPLDKAKYTGAQAALKAIEQRRIEVEALDKDTHTETVRIQQETLADKKEKEQFSRDQDAAIADAQIEYAALPAKQQNAQAAARIARSLKESTGLSVKPEDIAKGAKNPNAPQSVVNVGMTQEKEEAKKVGGGFGDQYVDLQKADLASRNKLTKYDRMDQLLGQIATGKLEPAKTSIQAVAESLGISVDKSLPSKQAFESLSSEIALTLRNPAGGAGMPGALSDKDREFLQGMVPNLAKTPEGNKLIIETARKIEQRSVEVAKMAREYRKKNTQFDEGFFDKLDEYSKANTLFKGNGSPQAKAAAKQETVPSIKSDADFNKLPSGSIFIGPDGKRRRKP